MSEQHEEPEVEPLVVEITVDASRCIRALENAQSTIVFASHPDLNGTGWERPGEEPTT